MVHKRTAAPVLGDVAELIRKLQPLQHGLGAPLRRAVQPLRTSGGTPTRSNSCIDLRANDRHQLAQCGASWNTGTLEHWNQNARATADAIRRWSPRRSSCRRTGAILIMPPRARPGDALLRRAARRRTSGPRAPARASRGCRASLACPTIGPGAGALTVHGVESGSAPTDPPPRGGSTGSTGRSGCDLKYG